MKQNQEYLYELSLTEKQAQTVSRACELYCRLLIGQLDELNHDLLLANTKEDICQRREKAIELILQLKELYFPELHGLGHSHGIGHNETADRAWDVYQVLRYQSSWHHSPQGGLGVNFDPPMAHNAEPLPKCEIITEKRKD